MIIGIGGKISSGKSEIAKYLAKKFNLPTMAFAKGLKDVITGISGLDDSHKGSKKSYCGNVNFGFLNSILKRYNYPQLTQQETDTINAIEYHTEGEVYRLLMQYIGTEVFRSRNPNHWIDIFCENVSKFKDGFICDDVRFPNEHNAIKGRFNDDYIKTIKVVNPKAKPTDSHDSEVLLDRIQFDVVFENAHKGVKNDTDGIKILHSKIDRLFENITII